VSWQRIATEEAFSPEEMMAAYRRIIDDGALDDPGFYSLWGHYLTSDSDRARGIRQKLVDLDDIRIADMDATGIDRQIISLTAPGVHVLERDEAIGIAALANDQLAEAVGRHPDRYSGLAAMAPQAPGAAAREIERGIETLGFRGVILNSHVDGQYLDDQKFWEIFEVCEQLDVPIYLHPNTPSKHLIGPMLDMGLDGAIFGFGVETGLHLLRIIVSVRREGDEQVIAEASGFREAGR